MSDEEVSNVSTRTIRDWRGIKHQLSHYSSDELVGVLVCATNTQEQLQRFVQSIEAELGQRAKDPQTSPA
jgi:hypothetical protein